MIYLKSESELALMRASGILVKQALELAREKIRPGTATSEIDKAVSGFIAKNNAAASFLGYGGFPKSVCVSIDDEVVHGIPDEKRFLHEGSIVSVDIGVFKDGFHADAARTFAVGRISEEKQKLIAVTEQSFFKGAELVKEGTRLGDIGYAINAYVESFGYSTVKVLVGHGIGRQLHEEPSVPNYGSRGKGLRLSAGMTIAIEPMINVGTFEVVRKKDGWTYVTKDGKPSAHYENTLAVTLDGCEMLTL